MDNKVLSLDLKTVRESLIKTVCGSEFQTDGAENRKARLEKSVLVNGWTSSGMADERKVRLQTRSVDSVVQQPQLYVLPTSRCWSEHAPGQTGVAGVGEPRLDFYLHHGKMLSDRFGLSVCRCVSECSLVIPDPEYGLTGIIHRITILPCWSCAVHVGSIRSTYCPSSLVRQDQSKTKTSLSCSGLSLLPFSGFQQ